MHPSKFTSFALERPHSPHPWLSESSFRKPPGLTPKPISLKGSNWGYTMVYHVGCWPPSSPVAPHVLSSSHTVPITSQLSGCENRLRKRIQLPLCTPWLQELESSKAQLGTDENWKTIPFSFGGPTFDNPNPFQTNFPRNHCRSKRAEDSQRCTFWPMSGVHLYTWHCAAEREANVFTQYVSFGPCFWAEQLASSEGRAKLPWLLQAWLPATKVTFCRL